MVFFLVWFLENADADKTFVFGKFLCVFDSISDLICAVWKVAVFWYTREHSM